MSLRRILVPVVGRDCDRSTLKMAAQIAQKVDAHIDALFVRVDPAQFFPNMGYPYTGSGFVTQDILDSANKASDELAEKARDSVATVVREMGIRSAEHGEASDQPSISFHQATGPLFSVLQRESQLTDLVVYAYPPKGIPSELANVLPGLLLGCRRPFLIAPEEPVQSLGNHIMIAWDADDEAASALRQAREFLPYAETVEVVMVTDDEAYAEEEIARPLAYLACHGVKAQSRIIFDEAGHAGDIILNTFDQSDADLLVMGAYGHSRVREFIFGGATRQILHQANFPVFMAH